MAKTFKLKHCHFINIIQFIGIQHAVIFTKQCSEGSLARRAAAVFMVVKSSRSRLQSTKDRQPFRGSAGKKTRLGRVTKNRTPFCSSPAGPDSPTHLDLEKLTGRRVSVPQEVFGFTDDADCFCFAGTIISTRTKSLSCSEGMVHFDYTGEDEWFSLPDLVKWLQPDLTALCTTFATL
eukprot:6196815-Pleurochrysis_carterae.AAC.1